LWFLKVIEETTNSSEDPVLERCGILSEAEGPKGFEGRSEDENMRKSDQLKRTDTKIWDENILNDLDQTD
jgi:hypothetical protein